MAPPDCRYNLTFSPDKRHAAMSTNHGSAVFFDLVDMKIVHSTPTIGPGKLASIAFSHNGALAAVAMHDTGTLILNVAGWWKVSQMGTHGFGDVQLAAFSASDKYVVVAHEGGVVRILEIYNHANHLSKQTFDLAADIDTLVVTPNLRVSVGFKHPKSVGSWSVHGQTKNRTFKGYSSHNFLFASTPTGKRTIVVSYTRPRKASYAPWYGLLDAETGYSLGWDPYVRKAPAWTADFVVDAATLSHGGNLVAVSGGRNIKLLSLDAETLYKNREDRPITSMAFSYDGKYLMYVTDDRRIHQIFLGKYSHK